MEKIKTDIIFTVTNDLSYDQRMMRICGTLSDAGYAVELVGRKRKYSIPLAHKSYKQTRLNCYFSQGKLFYIEYNLRLFFYLLFSNAKVLSAIDLDTLLPNTIVSKIRSRKLVFDAHEYFTEVPEVYNRKFTRAIWSRLAKICIPHADEAYTVSHSLAEIFTNAHHKKFEVIRNVPLYKRSILPQPSMPPVLFYQGDVNEGRGLEQIITAMPSINAHLRIAGEGPLLNDLKELVVQLKLEDKVSFLGYVQPDQLPDLLAKVTIGLNVLENRGLSYYYSLANKFFAYMHAGVPQICAPFPEYVHINAQMEVAELCECSTTALADTVNNLLQDPERYHKLQQHCIRMREQYSWQSESQKIIRIYQNVCT